MDKSKQKYASLFAKYLVEKYKLTGRLLDVGSGDGEFKEAFMMQGLNYTGVDISPKNPDTFYCDISKNNLQFEDKTFDVIFLRYVIEHIPKENMLCHTIHEIKRVLKPGGRLIVITTNWETNVVGFYDAPDHVSPYTINTLRRLFDVNGFRRLTLRTFRNLPLLWRYFYSKLIFDIKYPGKDGLLYVGEKE